MKCSIETHPTHTDIAAMTALLNSREISIADNIQLSDFDNLEELSLKLVDYIFSKRIFRD